MPGVFLNNITLRRIASYACLRKVKRHYAVRSFLTSTQREDSSYRKILIAMRMSKDKLAVLIGWALPILALAGIRVRIECLWVFEVLFHDEFGGSLSAVRKNVWFSECIFVLG